MKETNFKFEQYDNLPWVYWSSKVTGIQLALVESVPSMTIYFNCSEDEMADKGDELHHTARLSTTAGEARYESIITYDAQAQSLTVTGNINQAMESLIDCAVLDERHQQTLMGNKTAVDLFKQAKNWRLLSSGEELENLKAENTNQSQFMRSPSSNALFSKTSSTGETSGVDPTVICPHNSPSPIKVNN